MKIRLKETYMHFFTILNILGIISCFHKINQLGVITSAIILLIFLLHFNINLVNNDIIFAIFIIANILSVIAYLWNGRPFNIFLAAVSFNLIPSLLYYIGKLIAVKGQTEKFISNTLDALFFMMLFGTIFYILFPSIYYQYIGASIDSYAYGLGEYRYGSYISSLALGSVSTISIILYFYIYEELSVIKKIIYLPLIILNVIMCMQRSAWILSLIALIVCLLYKFNNSRRAKLGIIGISLIIFVAIILLWNNRSKIFTTTQLLYFERRTGTLNFHDLITSRNNQWSQAIRIFKENFVIGYGLGSCGQKAAPYGLAIVTDGNHLRILTEIGLFGFVAFVYTNIISVINGIREHKFLLSFAIIICNIAAIGSPIFDQYYASFIYWILLGCISITEQIKDTSQT